jgi:hypothetical protein
MPWRGTRLAVQGDRNPNPKADWMRPVTRSLRFSLAAVMSASLLAACGGSDDNLDDRLDLADPKVRVVHAVPEGPDVTLQRNGVDETEARDLPYKSASPYYDVKTEDYAFRVISRPGNVELAQTALRTDRGNKYTLVALLGGSGVELLAIRDPYNKGTSNDARLRVLNAAPNAQAFDVYVVRQGADLAALAPQMANVGYKQVQPASGSDSVQVSGGTYRLLLTPQGSKTPFFSATVAPPDNGDWLLVALPSGLGPRDLRLLLVRAEDDGPPTEDIVSE